MGIDLPLRPTVHQTIRYPNSSPYIRVTHPLEIPITPFHRLPAHASVRTLTLPAFVADVVLALVAWMQCFRRQDLELVVLSVVGAVAVRHLEVWWVFCVLVSGNRGMGSGFWVIEWMELG
jgi:hypothetical protein